MLCGGDWGLSVKQRDAPDASGRLVSIMIDVCKNKIGEDVCVCGGGGRGRRKGRTGEKKEGEWGGEIKRRGRGEGGKWEVGREKENLIFREQDNILNGGRVQILNVCRMGISPKVSWLWCL